AAGAQVPRDVGEGHNWLIEEHHAELAHHHLEAATADSVDLHVCQLKAGPAASYRSLSSERQERFGNVGSNCAPAWLHLSRGCDRRLTTPAAHVEHPLARPKLQGLKEQGRNAIGENLALCPGFRPR